MSTFPTMPVINLQDYDYELPEERIAQSPVTPRDHARLLYYRAGNIQHHYFYELPTLLNAGDELVFNNTKVIPARLFFQKPMGAVIEVLLLHPVSPAKLVPLNMATQETCSWQCIIGNKKRWKGFLSRHFQIDGKQGTIFADLEDPENNIVRFHWTPNSFSFGEIVQAIGKLPLPPYIKREYNHIDKERYQTVYARSEGAVAAPTAGLHFTETTLHELSKKGVGYNELTLHVGAGTFQPVKETEDVLKHPMHEEQMVVSQDTIERFLQAKGRIIPVGTTSMRSLETLYWLGVWCHEEKEPPSLHDFYLDKLFAYRHAQTTLSARQALEVLLDTMQKQGIRQLVGDTQIYIVPGYRFRICQGLITNFHMPKTTLILLVAAFIGDDWRRVYEAALKKNYRFLSYGDSSLLMPESFQ
ncbi:S-adenosylmethionine:tRNA ribosyltransferase-isomerase [Thermonema lapsum]|uniref:S-adenosylmethionine:tRNA ribosyltransferase-isomerase n=1 Tax=Thermonema lapsum TaxID=28195 RepID=A0A846MTR5_9BACT|nr:S-adenosylmethionine:tRNA ribosyltransferase-isomerase [Thermonema lapsum]NIK74821.1 S-adenosylmethionine:tRNA ribosyltransferase-isomerase [Thermonema lapsum]